MSTLMWFVWSQVCLISFAVAYIQRFIGLTVNVAAKAISTENRLNVLQPAVQPAINLVNNGGTIGGSLTIDGNHQVNGNQVVTGDHTVDNDVTIGGNNYNAKTVFTNLMQDNGAGTINVGTGNMITSNDMQVNGNLDGNGGVLYVGNTLTADGDVTIGGTLRPTGAQFNGIPGAQGAASGAPTEAQFNDLVDRVNDLIAALFT
jgi:hypothetical protein